MIERPQKGSWGSSRRHLVSASTEVLAVVEGVTIRDDVGLSGDADELVRVGVVDVNVVTSVDGFDEESGPSRGRGGHGDGPLGLTREGEETLLGPSDGVDASDSGGASQETEVTLEGLESGGVVEVDSGGLVQSTGSGTDGGGGVGVGQSPVESGLEHAALQALHPSGNTRGNTGGVGNEGVISVGGNTEDLGLGEGRPPGTGRVGQEELISRSGDDILVQTRVARVVRLGIDDTKQSVPLGGAQVVQDSSVDVVVQSERPSSIDAVHSINKGRHVTHGHNDGGNTNDTLVYGGGRPAGPSTLGGSSDDEALDVDTLGGHEGLDGIHTTNNSLGHGQESSPLGLRGVLHVADPGPGDQSILRARSVGGIVEEGDGLVGNLGQV